ncbi:MAG: Rieske (2Fe-2S) protein [Wenzhouxiangellaceae bacterium]
MTPKSVDQFLFKSSALAEGEFREASVEHNGEPLWLVVTRHQGTPRAWLNVCPHQGRSLNWAPDKFLVDDQGRLVCAAHGAVFEPADGSCVSGPCAGAALREVNVTEYDGSIVSRGPS